MEWETFYNCHSPHASLKGKTSYEILLEKLQSNPTSTEVISSTTLVVKLLSHGCPIQAIVFAFGLDEMESLSLNEMRWNRRFH
jgi:hypothetical protein